MKDIANRQKSETVYNLVGFEISLRTHSPRSLKML